MSMHNLAKGGIRPPAGLTEQLRAIWVQKHNERWAKMSSEERKVWKRAYETDMLLRGDLGLANLFLQSQQPSVTAKQPSLPPALPDPGLLAKGGIMVPQNLTIEQKYLWRDEHAKRWKKMTAKERVEMQEAQRQEQQRKQHDEEREKNYDQARAQMALAAEPANDHPAQRSRKRRRPENDDSDEGSDEEAVIKNEQGSPAVQHSKGSKRICFHAPAAEPARIPEASQPARPQTQTITRIELPPRPPMPQGQTNAGSELPARPPMPRAVKILNVVDWEANIVFGDQSPIGLLEIAPHFPFGDAHVDQLSQSPSMTRTITQIVAGNPDLRIPLTDAGLARLASACPRLEYLSIHGAVRLSDEGLSAVVEHCVFIRRISLCGADFEPNRVRGSALLDVAERRVAVFLEKITLRNTAVETEAVRELRDARPLVRISNGL